MKQSTWILIIAGIAMQAAAQTWPDFYLTNGTHNTSYGVETYDPATVKNLYVNPTAILNPGGDELGNVYDGNQLILNGGRIHTAEIDNNDFTWNSGTLKLTGGIHQTTYGLSSGTGKTLILGDGASLLSQESVSLPYPLPAYSQEARSFS